MYTTQNHHVRLDPPVTPAQTLRLFTELSQGGWEISRRARKILSQNTYIPNKKEYLPIDQEPYKLGFHTKPTYDEVYRQVKKRGFCHFPLGSVLSFCLKEDKENTLWGKQKSFVIGIEPVKDHEGHPSIFLINYANENSKYLSTQRLDNIALIDQFTLVIFAEEM